MISVKPSRAIINRNHPLARGLSLDVLLYENGGLKVTDLAKGKVGTINNAGGNNWVVGQPGPGVSFDKSTSQILFASNPNQLTNNFSVETWFTAVLPQQTGFLFYNGDDGAGWGMGAGGSSDTTNSNLFGLMGGSSWLDPAGATLTSNTLTQGVYVQNAGTAFFAINGGDFISAGSHNPGVPVANKSAIGVETDGFRKFQGNIFCVRVWDRTLSQQDVRDLYKNPWQIYAKPTKTFNSPVLSGIFAKAFKYNQAVNRAATY